MIMLRFGKTKLTKEKFYDAKNPLTTWDVDINNIVILKVVKTNSRHLVGYLDNVIRPSLLMLRKLSRHVQIFKVKNGDKNKNSKFYVFPYRRWKMLKEIDTIWTEIEDLKKYWIECFTSL